MYGEIDGTDAPTSVEHDGSAQQKKRLIPDNELDRIVTGQYNYHAVSSPASIYVFCLVSDSLFCVPLYT